MEAAILQQIDGSGADGSEAGADPPSADARTNGHGTTSAVGSPPTGKASDR
jgi:hypothetical protein